MPEVASARTETYATHLPAALSTAASVSKAGSDMKNNGKDKTLASDDNQKELVQKEEQEEEATKSEAAVDPSLNADLKATEKQEKNINGRGGSNSDTESGPIDTPIFAGEANQDAEMREASPTPADVTEQDMPMMEAAPLRETSGSGASEGISQEDLDGGLLDGALDDYDDLDQDTEDTEVGNGDDDFSDDDDDDDDDMDGRLLDSSNKPGPDDEMHSPATMSRADTVKSDDRDMDMHDDTTDHQDKETTLGHSDDSDSDLPEPEGSDNEHEDDEDEDDEEDEGEDDEMDEEDEEIMPVKKVPELKKDFGMSQKPILNRPPATEEELKDSGDELSDLSEFDDSDDSDEDDMPKIKVSNKEFVANSSSAATASTAQGNGKPEPGGRKRSVQDSSTIKQDLDSVKTEHEEQSEVPNGKARASDRKASEAEDTHHSDKESFSEAHGEEEEKVAEEEEEEEEDLEKKQLHKDALEALTSIEVEFANLRDKMYEERMMELDREVDMINAGTHPELSSLMQEIEHKREQRLRFAEMGKRYLIDIAESAYQVAEYRAHCTFQVNVLLEAQECTC
ncbi:hypothetical protein BC939DRAFT_77261 [Gamsiella multidivaricata]|uniref:uncharacterized protein n=1 Tax=Gamsiella multidivaricata TaxID=101098 RepID=UPI00221E66FC|nr:uncharacterized protein BC939DRAFT_77261 [Gamsiella multidivaricata]KAI7828007.1 hypothetical protein BC939DRAFT_77261 [Gamsiella multidivaricata]